MTFLEELRDIQNCILGKSQELNSSKHDRNKTSTSDGPFSLTLVACFLNLR